MMMMMMIIMIIFTSNHVSGPRTRAFRKLEASKTTSQDAAAAASMVPDQRYRSCKAHMTLKLMLLRQFLELSESSRCVPCEDNASDSISELSGDPTIGSRRGTCAGLFFHLKAQQSEPDQVWDRIMNVGNRGKLVK